MAASKSAGGALAAPSAALAGDIGSTLVSIGVGVLLWFVSPFRNVWALAA